MSQVSDTSDILRRIRRAWRVIESAPSLFIVLGGLLFGAGFLLAQQMYGSQLGVAQQHIEQLRDRITAITAPKKAEDMLKDIEARIASKPVPPIKPLKLLSAKDILGIPKKPKPLEDGRYSLEIHLIDPLKLSLPTVEIRNVSDEEIKLIVREYSIAIGRFDIFKEKFGPFKLLPNASQRISPKTPLDVTFINKKTNIEVEVGILYKNSEKTGNYLNERFWCDISEEQVLSECYRMYSSDRIVREWEGKDPENTKSGSK